MNGSGKSSLLRILAKEDEEFKGDYQLAPSVRVGYLPQEPKLDDSATVLQNIEPAVQPVRDMLKEFEEVTSDPDSLVYTRLFLSKYSSVFNDKRLLPDSSCATSALQEVEEFLPRAIFRPIPD